MIPDHNVFTEEALKAQQGKKVPVTLEIGGPVIGEATLKYDSEAGALLASMKITDPKVAGFLVGGEPSVIFKKES